MTDADRLSDIDEQLALLSAERRMLETKARAGNGLLAVDAEYAKLRLKRIAKEETALKEQRTALANFISWDSRTRLL